MIFLKHNQYQQQGFAFVGIVLGVLVLVTGIGLISLAKQKRAAKNPIAVSTTKEEKFAQPSLSTNQEQRAELQRQTPVTTLEKPAGNQPAVDQSSSSRAKPSDEGTRRPTTRRSGPSGGQSARINPANPTDPQIANFCLQNPGDPSCFQHYLIFKDNPSINQLPYFAQLRQIYGSGQPPHQTYLNPLNNARINPANPTDPQIANFCLQNPGDPSCFQHYLIFKDNPSINQLPYFAQLRQIYGSGQPPHQTYLNPLNNPDINPLANPDINPLMNPDINPLANPDINPMADPSLNPGCIPCQFGWQNPYQQNPYQQPGVNPQPGIPGIPGGYNPGGGRFGRWGR